MSPSVHLTSMRQIAEVRTHMADGADTLMGVAEETAAALDNLDRTPVGSPIPARRHAVEAVYLEALPDLAHEVATSPNGEAATRAINLLATACRKAIEHAALVGGDQNPLARTLVDAAVMRKGLRDVAAILRTAIQPQGLQDAVDVLAPFNEDWLRRVLASIGVPAHEMQHVLAKVL